MRADEDLGRGGDRRRLLRRLDGLEPPPQGLSVLLVDSTGPPTPAPSSGGESRIIRMGYGPDELYTRMSLRSLAAWQRLGDETREPLFHPTGVLWLARAGDRYTADTLATLARVGVPPRAPSTRTRSARATRSSCSTTTSGASSSRRAAR